MGSLRHLKKYDIELVIENFFRKKGFLLFSREPRPDFIRFLFKQCESDEGVLVLYSPGRLDFFYVPTIHDPALRSWWIADVGSSTASFTEASASHLLQEVLERGRKLYKGQVEWEV